MRSNRLSITSMPLHAIFVALLVLAVWLPVAGQRRITPVKGASKGVVGINENRNRTDSLGRSPSLSPSLSPLNTIETIGPGGETVLVDTVTGREVVDSLPPGAPVGRVPKMQQPLLFSTSVGVDIWEPLMRCFGQHYGLIGFGAELNLHNRYIPAVEVGLGTADNTPKDQNYTFHADVAPYFQIGANYNFLYNSNPDYQFYAGLRYGFTHFSYQLRDVTIGDPYWGEQQVVDFPAQSSSVSYLNVLFGLKVKIVGPLSMGWAIKFRTILHQSAQPAGLPSYIPGYGSRNGAVNGAFTIYYTIPFRHKSKTANIPLTDENSNVQ